MKLIKLLFVMIVLFVLVSCDSSTSINSSLPSKLSQEFSGSGEIYEIKSGTTITIPEENRHNILIISEGYRQQELDQGIFEQDVKDWVDEAVLVEPLKSFKQAFNIWKHAAVSQEQVILSDTQIADTALSVPILASGNVGTELDESAIRIWKIADDSKLLTDNYYSKYGKGNRRNKNLTVVVLVYNPEKGKSGFGGRARTLSNPQNEEQRLSVAFAHDRSHEFLHAFAFLVDEYIEDDTVRTWDDVDYESSLYLTNVVPFEDASQTPWAHLLNGGKYNSTEDLVGTFGNAANGYHSEAKCLMNGRHDNAAYYGGSGWLRVYDRLSNWGREITIFRLYERLGLFNNPDKDFATWKAEYRDKYYLWYSFVVPDTVPQVNSDGDPLIPISQ